jgi:hypothetical protein
MIYDADERPDERPDGQPEEAEEEDEISPDDPDYDLSEAHGYLWYPKRDDEHALPRWFIAIVAAGVITALVLPAVLLVLSRG